MTTIFKDRSYKISFTWAAIIHLLVVIMLLLKFNSPTYQSINNNNIIQATAVSDFEFVSATTKPEQQPPPLAQSLPPPKAPVLSQAKMVAQDPQATVIIKNKRLKIQKEIERSLAKEAVALQTQKQKQLLENSLNKELAKEKTKLDAVAAEQARGIINKYKAAILQTIAANWIVPAGLSNDLECILLITVAPKGIVLDTKVLKSSGQRVLDQSAQTAVLKSSPLPVPEDLSMFDEFRSIKLTVHPKNAGGLIF